jgi:hypothetical protein
MAFHHFLAGFAEGFAMPFLIVRDLCVAIWRVLADYASGRRPAKSNKKARA